MQIHERAFSAKVELPCKIFCGPDSMLEISGTALNINPASLLLDVRDLRGPWQPAVGEWVKLELLLPLNGNHVPEHVKPKVLSVRARIASVTALADGSRQLELRFRKPTFKDQAENGNGHRKPAKASGVYKWEM
jgi:hypothetical protein